MTIGDFSAYGYFILTVSLSILFMGYVYHLYTAKKKGTKDYEKYGNIALNDELTDELVEKKMRTLIQRTPNERWRDK